MRTKHQQLRRSLIILAIVVVGVVTYNKIIESRETEHRLSIESIVAMGRLELVRINIKDVLTQTKERPFLPLPDAKALLIVVGEVYAGIDLTKVKKEDFVESENQITIRLPRPEILIAKVSQSKSRVYDVRWGGWSEVELVEAAYKAAEEKILESARYSGYVETCKKNARLLLLPLFSALAAKKVVLEFK